MSIEQGGPPGARVNSADAMVKVRVGQERDVGASIERYPNRFALPNGFGAFVPRSEPIGPGARAPKKGGVQRRIVVGLSADSRSFFSMMAIDSERLDFERLSFRASAVSVIPRGTAK